MSGEVVPGILVRFEIGGAGGAPWLVLDEFPVAAVPSVGDFVRLDVAEQVVSGVVTRRGWRYEGHLCVAVCHLEHLAS